MKHDVDSAELKIARVIRVMVLISAGVILVGFIAYLVTGASGYPGDSFPTDPRVILAGIAAFRPYAVILLGLFILIMTPFARILLSAFAFARQKDTLYVIITSAVFIILMISILIGGAE